MSLFDGFELHFFDVPRTEVKADAMPEDSTQFQQFAVPVRLRMAARTPAC